MKTAVSCHAKKVGAFLITFYGSLIFRLLDL